MPRKQKRPCIEDQLISDIVSTLKRDEERRNRRPKRPITVPEMKVWKYKPPHTGCIPMTPSMHTRLRYITHCDPYPKPREYLRTTYDDYYYPDEEKARRKVRYVDEDPCCVTALKTPASLIKHSPSDRSIINMPSPKTSGEVISAQKADVKPAEVRPPIPSTSGHALFKPHSGIVINMEKDFVPISALPGPRQIPGPSKKRRRPCHKGGICVNKYCKKKKCRRAAERRRKRIAANLRSGMMGMKGFATDGTPRMRGKMRRIPGDDEECGLDEMPRPEFPQVPSNLPRHALRTHSLTVMPCVKELRGDTHYGILNGSFNMYSDKFGGKSRGKQALAMSVMAYCLAFHYHPKQWTMKLIDNLMDAGDQWYQLLAEKQHDHSSVQGMCEVLKYGKKETLILNQKRMLMYLGEPYIVGYTLSTDPTIYNLCKGLKTFFKEHRAAIMMTRVLKLVIWKDKVCFYVFDPAGRNSKAVSNYSTGTAALINVKDEEAVADLLLAKSILEDQRYVLAPIKVIRMVDEKSDEDFEMERELTQAEKASMSYRILDENRAIVNANMHLGDRCFEDSKFRQSLPIAVTAMTYAKISPPNTWYSKTLDKIMLLGNKMYTEFTPTKGLVDLTIDNIPNEINLGPYSCEIIIYRDRVKGQLFTTKECIFNIRTGLQEFFKNEYNSGILDFSGYKLAVWRQKDMFYMFDPYPRTMDGERTLKNGKACCFMLLSPDTMAEVFTDNWDYLPQTTQFSIHAFKVLKIKKKSKKGQIKCTLSDTDHTDKGKKVKRKVLPVGPRGEGYGDAGTGLGYQKVAQDVFPIELLGPDGKKGKVIIDEEKMGDIISLVDSIQEEYVPPIPMKYKRMGQDAAGGGAEDTEKKISNLDSPTVSVTQVVPPWPKPRDKSNEPPDLDPSPEPTPPPTPPPPPIPEGGLPEEEEKEEEELDEEALKAKKEEMKRKKLEEEEARRKAEELPPPLAPPPPSPQPSDTEVALAPASGGLEDEMEMQQPYSVTRHILLTEDARKRYTLRQMRKTMTRPLQESPLEAVGTPSEEFLKPSNFKTLPDTTQIIRGTTSISEDDAYNVLPFAAIMAIITSYKYSVNTWTPTIVDFIVEGGHKLYKNKKEKFQLAPMHVIPKIAVGHQAYHANIDVVAEGPTWKLENILDTKFFPKYDRGILTTPNYSCAFFVRNGVFYLYDASPCNAMGLRELSRDSKEKSKGKASFMRFKNLHDLACRIVYNKDGAHNDEQFILSRILVRRLLPEARRKLPEDYDWEKRASTGKKSRFSIDQDDVSAIKKQSKSTIQLEEKKSEPAVGYQNYDGIYRIEGTTALTDKSASRDVKVCHFVGLIAMLLAAMHPLRTWDHFMVDCCLEKGQEIMDKSTNCGVCEKRVIKNIILDGKFVNVNIKKIIVINENPEKTLEQYMKAVLRRLRYVMIRFPECTLVVCQNGGYYHLFDPYDSTPGFKKKKGEEVETEKLKLPQSSKEAKKVASWTLFRTLDELIMKVRCLVSSNVDSPEFYTFELTSVKNAPRHAALNYKLSPLFKADENPNMRYLRPFKKPRRVVNEKMYWLNIDPAWTRTSPVNDLGHERGTPKTLWKDWDIEFPGDLYSIWGTIHPLDSRFSEENRGKQYLATCVIALVMVEACDLAVWTGSFLDGIVIAGDKYQTSIAKKLGGKPNYELTVEDYAGSSDDLYPYSFTAKFNKVIFGFVYNTLPDRFNLSKALGLFFEKNTMGILTSPSKNLAFGKQSGSYFMFDCQSYGPPVFAPYKGAAYMLKCESLNRLIYCITMTLNLRSHGQQFHLYSANISLTEKSK